MNLSGQDLLGIHSGQSFQLQNLSYQPAEILHNGSKWDVNLLTFNFYSQNKMVVEEANFFEVARRLGVQDLEYLLGNNNSNFDASAEIQLPAFSYQISPRSAIAFSSNLRAYALYTASNEVMLSFINDEPIDMNNYPQNGVIESIVNTWIEINGAYAHQILNKGKHQIKSGITLRYIAGAATGYFNLDNLDLVMADAQTIEKLTIDYSYGSNTTLNALVEEQSLKLGQNRGLGMDIGAVYNLKNDRYHTAFNPNVFKGGFAVADIGYIKHRNTPSQKNNSMSLTNISADSFTGIKTLKELNDSLKNMIAFTEGDKEDMTIRLRINYKVYADYQFYENWSMHADFLYIKNTYQELLSQTPSGAWRLSLTPRYETINWGVFTPVVYHSIVDWHWGLSFKYRAFFCGSSSLLSNLIRQEPNLLNIYFGVNLSLK